MHDTPSTLASRTKNLKISSMSKNLTKLHKTLLLDRNGHFWVLNVRQNLYFERYFFSSNHKTQKTYQEATDRLTFSDRRSAPITTFLPIGRFLRPGSDRVSFERRSALGAERSILPSAERPEILLLQEKNFFKSDLLNILKVFLLLTNDQTKAKHEGALFSGYYHFTY